MTAYLLSAATGFALCLMGFRFYILVPATIILAALAWCLNESTRSMFVAAFLMQVSYLVCSVLKARKTKGAK